MSMVRARNFTFSYPGAEEHALDGVSFEIGRGETFGITGPVGA
jgi:energy-coupling factor transport system ATP-binding protein